MYEYKIAVNLSAVARACVLIAFSLLPTNLGRSRNGDAEGRSGDAARMWVRRRQTAIVNFKNVFKIVTKARRPYCVLIRTQFERIDVAMVAESTWYGAMNTVWTK